MKPITALSGILPPACRLLMVGGMVASGLYCGSCAPPRQEPLSLIGKDRIGPVSCAWSAKSAKEPTYETKFSRDMKTYLIGTGLISIAQKAVAEASEMGGQKSISATSRACGHPESALLMEEMPKAIARAGYTVRSGAPKTVHMIARAYGVVGQKDGTLAILVAPQIVLTDEKHKTMWFSAEEPTIYPTGHTFEQYAAQPELYRSDFRLAARAAVTKAWNGKGQWHMDYSKHGALIGWLHP